MNRSRASDTPLFDQMPSLGTFLWPIGHGYCAEVRNVYVTWWGEGRPGLPRILFRRWGWRDGKPFDDGHPCDGMNGVSLRPRGPGVWSSPAWSSDRPLYGFKLWRAVSWRPGGQGDLF